MTTDDETGKEPGVKNMRVFLLLFLLPAAFTYLSIVIVSIFAVLGYETLAFNETHYEATMRWMWLAACYSLMTLACAIRGLATNRMWLIAFPLVGAMFDIFLGGHTPTGQTSSKSGGDS